MKSIKWADHLFNFIAVILGVLIAFYIDAAAEARKEKKDRKLILQSFIEELKQDEHNFKSYQIPDNEQQSAGLLRLMEHLVSRQMDSIEVLLPVALGLNNSSPNNSTYLAVVSSGKINLIENVRTKKAITSYYDALTVEAQYRGEAQLNFFNDELIPWLMDHTDLLNLNAEDVAGRTDFVNRLLIYQSLIENKMEHYKVILKEAESLRKELEAALE